MVDAVYRQNLTSESITFGRYGTVLVGGEPVSYKDSSFSFIHNVYTGSDCNDSGCGCKPPKDPCRR
jgi:hypothetical protein